MPIKIKEKSLKLSDGENVKIEVTTFLGSIGLEYFAKISKSILPIILPMISKNSKEKNKSLLATEIDFNLLAGSISKYFNDESFKNLILGLVSETTYIDKEGRKDLVNKEVFDIVIAGEYGLLGHILKFILEVNFGSIFLGENGIAGLMQEIPETTKQILKSKK